MDYIALYYNKCLENKLLKDEIDVLEKIVRTSLPILERDDQEWKMVYDEMVKPLCWVMGLILLYGWGFAIPFSDIYPEHRSVGNDTGKVVLFILYVVISE